MTPRTSPRTPAPVLIVDDDHDDLFAVEETLAPLGLEIVQAHGGEEALRLLLARDFAAVVLDLMMPGMSGFETAGLIRRRERSRGTPILFLTGFDEDGIKLLPDYRPIEAEYLRKPVDPGLLRAKIAECVARFAPPNPRA